jgi:flagellar assembly factor FliW
MILDKRTSDPGLDVIYCPPGGTEATGAFVPADADLPRRKVLHVPTVRFGRLEVEPDLILTLPEGLIGFERCKRYVVVRPDERSAFRWLQSLEEPAVALPIVEPGELRPDYAPILSDADARRLELTVETPTLVFVIVTVPPHDPRAMTANLLGPLVINGLTRRGKQVIVQNEGYTTRHLVVEELLRTAAIQGSALTTEADPSGVRAA